MKLTEKDLRKIKEGHRKEDIVSSLIIRKISIQITKILVKTKLTPNQITFFSFLIGIVAAYCLATGVYKWIIVGGILVQLSYVFDCVDGEIARLKGIVSKKGAWIDTILDRFKEGLIIFGISFGLYNQISNSFVWVLGFIAFLSLFMMHSVLDTTAKHFGEARLGMAHSRFFLTRLLGRIGIKQEYLTLGIGVYLAIITIGAVLNQLIWVLLYFVFIHNLYWILMIILSWVKR